MQVLNVNQEARRIRSVFDYATAWQPNGLFEQCFNSVKEHGNQHQKNEFRVAVQQYFHAALGYEWNCALERHPYPLTPKPTESFLTTGIEMWDNFHRNMLSEYNSGGPNNQAGYYLTKYVHAILNLLSRIGLTGQIGSGVIISFLQGVIFYDQGLNEMAATNFYSYDHLDDVAFQSKPDYHRNVVISLVMTVSNGLFARSQELILQYLVHECVHCVLLLICDGHYKGNTHNATFHRFGDLVTATTEHYVGLQNEPLQPNRIRFPWNITIGEEKAFFNSMEVRNRVPVAVYLPEFIEHLNKLRRDPKHPTTARYPMGYKDYTIGFATASINPFDHCFCQGFGRQMVFLVQRIGTNKLQLVTFNPLRQLLTLAVQTQESMDLKQEHSPLVPEFDYSAKEARIQQKDAKGLVVLVCGDVGTVAIQMLKCCGVEWVLAICSKKYMNFMEGLGAIAVDCSATTIAGINFKHQNMAHNVKETRFGSEFDQFQSGKSERTMSCASANESVSNAVCSPSRNAESSHDLYRIGYCYKKCFRECFPFLQRQTTVHNIQAIIPMNTQ